MLKQSGGLGDCLGQTKVLSGGRRIFQNLCKNRLKITILGNFLIFDNFNENIAILSKFFKPSIQSCAAIRYQSEKLIDMYLGGVLVAGRARKLRRFQKLT